MMAKPIRALELHYPMIQFLINNNYSPKWRWLVLDIYWTAKQWGKYPRLATDTEVNNCFSIYKNSEIIEHKNDDF